MTQPTLSLAAETALARAMTEQKNPRHAAVVAMAILRRRGWIAKEQTLRDLERRAIQIQEARRLLDALQILEEASP